VIARTDAVRKEALLNVAAEWFQRMREGEPTAEDITAWLAWRGADGDHERAYREIQELWTLTGDAGIEAWPSEQTVRDDAYTGEQSIDAWNAQRATPGTTGGAYAQRRLLYPWALAASLALVLGMMFMSSHPPKLPAAQVFTTQRGESRQLSLSDGSFVTLGGASTLRLAFETTKRELFLDRGEAFFQVHHNKAAPFIVHTQRIAVTAIGTAFNVRADAACTVVAVTEGSVTIDGPRESVASMRVSAGDEVTIDSARHVAVQPTTAAATLGWIDGSLTFFDEPLRVVLARLNRYSSQELVLADPALGELRFTGTVFKDQVPEWASGLERVFPLHAVQSPNGAVLIVPTAHPHP
jgi:transmembrane sensor